MKKKMKKILSLILAVIMLISAVPMQSFAAFEWMLPEVVKVEFTDDIPVSNKFVQGVENADMSDVSLDYCNYSFKLYLSNGRTIETNNHNLLGPDLPSGVVFTSVYVRTDPKECAKAIAEGKSTVKVNVGVLVYYINETIRSYHFEMEKPIVEEIVKDVKLLDPMPETYDKYYAVVSFEGKRFEVEYGDGRKEILTVTKDKNDELAEYYLGDESIYMYYGENSYIDSVTGETVYYEGLEFSYIDTNVVLERKFLPCPFSSYEITDYKLDGKAGLTELAYKLTYKDGRVIEKSLSFDKPVKYEEYVVIDNVDGYDIYVGIEGWGEFYELESWIGNVVWGMESYAEGDIKDFCDCRCHKTGFLNFIINMFIQKIWQIFRINENCQCGYWHW